MRYPVSPNITTNSLCYFARMCDKVRLFEEGELSADYHKNLGKGMDLWTCQLLKIDYAKLVEQIKAGLSDELLLEWSVKEGGELSDLNLEWWNSYMRNRGFRDDLADKLALRIKESGFENRGIVTFFDYLDADEER